MANDGGVRASSRDFQPFCSEIEGQCRCHVRRRLQCLDTGRNKQEGRFLPRFGQIYTQDRAGSRTPDLYYKYVSSCKSAWTCSWMYTCLWPLIRLTKNILCAKNASGLGQRPRFLQSGVCLFSGMHLSGCIPCVGKVWERSEPALGGSHGYHVFPYVLNDVMGKNYD